MCYESVRCFRAAFLATIVDKGAKQLNKYKGSGGNILTA